MKKLSSLKKIIVVKNMNKFISKKELIEDGFNHLKPRTIEFYVRKGILKKGHVFLYNTRVFWRRDYIIDELKSIDIFSQYGLKLDQIAVMAEKTDFNLRSIVEDFVNIVEDYLDKKKKRLMTRYYSKLVSYRDACDAIQGFYIHIKRGNFDKNNLKIINLRQLKLNIIVNIPLNRLITRKHEKNHVS